MEPIAQDGVSSGTRGSLKSAESSPHLRGLVWDSIPQWGANAPLL